MNLFTHQFIYTPLEDGGGLYAKRGVSAQKEEVHAAIKNLDKGLYEFAFCKIYPDFINGDSDFINVMHADGAGTKSILAYLYWKETGDISVWKGIAQDAVVMNLDDLLCVGIYDNLLFSSTIDRNKLLIPGKVLEQVINGTQDFFNTLKSLGINIHFLGGETADVGDVVRTIAVNGTMMARWGKNKLITNEKIKAGNVIVGFASSGKATYENEYNSGIASNGLTSARHDVLHKYYGKKYPETFEPTLNDDVVYIGKNKFKDELINSELRTQNSELRTQNSELRTQNSELRTQNSELKTQNSELKTPNLEPKTQNLELKTQNSELNIGKLLLSPTRTYAPLMKVLLENYFDKIDGVIHCSGGGQTKCMKYLPQPLRIIKDNLFEAPEIFRVIQQNSNADDKEMYQVFNMGHRLEIFTDEATASSLIKEAGKFNIEAKIVGRVEASLKKELELHVNGNIISY